MASRAVIAMTIRVLSLRGGVPRSGTTTKQSPCSSPPVREIASSSAAQGRRAPRNDIVCCSFESNSSCADSLARPRRACRRPILILVNKGLQPLRLTAYFVRFRRERPVVPPLPPRAGTPGVHSCKGGARRHAHSLECGSFKGLKPLVCRLAENQAGKHAIPPAVK